MKKIKTPKHMADTATQRSNIYALLATIYYKEVDPAFLKQIKNPGFLGVLSDMVFQLKDDILQKPEDKIIEDLAVEYTRLFLGPGKHISPHESIHHERSDGDWGRFWGKDTVLVKKFIETAGLEYRSEFTGMPDHISVELEFMHKAAEQEAQAWKENNSDGALYCLKMQKKFVDEHLIKWIPKFCDKVISQAELSFYREMAKLTKGFVEFEKKEMDEYISEAKKLVSTGI
ncbi:MAG: molecular chaperone TorD family protein [Nitrospirae bacterium]|nr:molecular chaperone TorD family protein [Nitrospirota bacterium]